ncbi:DUF692 family protein [bacterium NHP-B]|nr:DUF692 family protein [bacterium NHP-B]
MFKIGAGFNPCFLNPKEHPFHLSIPKCVSLLELGHEEFKLSKSVFPPFFKQALSLHIARSPIGEPKKAQDPYIEDLVHFLGENEDFLSVGFHLTGERHANIGRYGFSSYYNPNDPALEERAIYFINTLQRRLGKTVWVENTNFYSPLVQNPLLLWRSVERICAKTGARVIFDLAHHMIDCQNSSIPPESLMGAVPWDCIIEIHLSGVTISKDGALHDGHNTRIPEQEWKLLDMALLSFVKDPSEIYVTLEHTDLDWRHDKEGFYADFERLRRVQKKCTRVPETIYAPFQDRYAKSRLKILLLRRMSDLCNFSDENDIDLNCVIDEWLLSLSLKQGERLVMSAREEEEGAFHAHKLFRDFFASRYGKCA